MMQTFFHWVLRGSIILFITTFYYTSSKAQFDSSEKKTEMQPSFLEIGFRLNSMSNNDFLRNTNNTGGNTTKQNYNGQNFNAGITIQSFRNNILTRITFNYAKSNENVQTKYDSNSGNYIIINSETKRGVIEITPGIGKIINLKSFTLKYGIDVPFSINQPAIDIVSREIYDIYGNVNTEKITTKYPQKGYKIKAAIFTDLEYNIFKQFFLEIGLLNGIGYSYYNTTYQTTYESSYNGSITTAQSENKIKEQRIYTDWMNFHLGINYRF